MSDDKDKLKALRDEIDQIDRQLHALIMRRTEVVEGVRAVKEASQVMIRPSREAEILYRLMADHKGPFPKRELGRIWRELIVATLSFEGPFSVAVFNPEDEPGYWDLARDQYGTFSEMVRHGSARAAVEAVRERKATLGILPFPHRDRDEPWWRFLVSEAPETPKVIARLPFIPGSNVRNRDLEALVICPIAQEETGRDRSLLAVEAEADIGYPAIENALRQAGFAAVFHQLWHDPNRPPGWTYLVEVYGFVGPDSRQLRRLRDALGTRVARILQLGGYATPLSETDLVQANDGDAGEAAQ
ncbi:MAG: chorismate mutase [Rhodospirillaceae bacterium]